MNIILDQIEFILPESVFRLVKNSVELGRVKKASEVKKNIWQFIIKYEDSYVECEIKFGRNQVQKIICACGRSNLKHPCLHSWIASFWYYNEVVLNKTQSKPVTTALQEIDYSKLSVDQLVPFVKLSLKLHKDLARWADMLINYSIVEFDTASDFLQKLNTFRLDKNSNSSSKLKIFNEQLILLNQLYNQVLEQYSSGFLEIAFSKTLCTIIKTSEWITDYPLNNHQKLSKLFFDFHMVFEQIIKDIKSPELLDHCLDLSENILSEHYYRLLHPIQNIYTHLLNAGTNKKIKENIKKIYIQNLIKNEPSIDLINIQFILNYFDLNKFKSILHEHLTHSVSIQTWLILLKKLEEQGQLLLFDKHLICILKEIKHRETQLKYASKIINEYNEQGLTVEAATLSKDLSVLLLSPEIAKLYYLSTNKSVDKLHELMQVFKAQKHIDHEILILEILNQTEQTEQLLIELQNCQNIELVMQYDKILYSKYANEILLIYINFAARCFNDYAGQAAYQYIEKIKSHIQFHGRKILSDRFDKEIQRLFPERNKLLNIIN